MRACAEHLRQYNEGLGLSNTIRMRDALHFLNKYHEEEMKNKTTPDEEQVIQITDTERFLFNLFKGKGCRLFVCLGFGKKGKGFISKNTLSLFKTVSVKSYVMM